MGTMLKLFIVAVLFLVAGEMDYQDAKLMERAKSMQVEGSL